MFFLLIALLLTVVSAQAKDAVSWFRVDIPPVYILAEERGKGGFGEESMQFVIDRLPQYQHDVVTMNLSRGVAQFKEGTNICFSTLLKNSEREEFIEFSIPSQLVLPLHLVVREKDLSSYSSLLNDDGEVNLEKMLSEGNQLLGIAAGRSYSSTIDDILADFGDHSNVYSRSSMDVAGGLLRMLQLGRVDCILEFPVTVGYTLKVNQSDSTPLVFLPIQGMPPFFQAHFAAPKTPWGRKIISEINDVLRKCRTSKEFVGMYGGWLSGQTRERYEKIVQQEFGSQ